MPSKIEKSIIYSVACYLDKQFSIQFLKKELPNVRYKKHGSKEFKIVVSEEQELESKGYYRQKLLFFSQIRCPYIPLFQKMSYFIPVFPVYYPVSNPLSFPKVHSKLNLQPHYKICSYFTSKQCTFITVTNKTVCCCCCCF